MRAWDDNAFLDLLYGAAVEPSRWPDAMAMFADRIGGEKSWLSMLNQVDGSGGGIISRIDPVMPERYAAHFGQRNPLFNVDNPRAYLATWRPRILTDEDWIPKEELLRSEYYNDFLKPQDIHSAVMIRLAVDGDQTSTLNVTRSHRDGQFGREQLEIAAGLHAHLRRAFDLTRRMAEAAMLHRDVVAALDRLPHGVFLLDGVGRVRHANRAADSLMAAGGSLTVISGRLSSPFPDAARRLHALVGSAASPEPGLAKGGTMTLRAPGRRLPYTLNAAPGPHSGVFPMYLGRSVIIWVTDPQAGANPSAELLREIYGLTPAEGRVAVALLEGIGAKDAAERLGVSVNTIRNQVQSLLAKTGARRQSELVRMLLRAMGPQSD